MKTLISINIIENFALCKGIFKIKHIEKFRNEHQMEVTEMEVDRLNFLLDNIDENLLVNLMPKEEWQKKINLINMSQIPELSIAIFSTELEAFMKD